MRNKDLLKKELEELINSDFYKERLKLLEEKRKSVKTGSNVVHINYFDKVITSEELTSISNSLEVVNLELSSYDQSADIRASLEDFTNMMYVGLSSELTKNIVFGVLGNFAWEAIKKITKIIFSKVKNENVNSKTKKKELTFGLHLSLNKNTGFNFRLDSKLSSESVDEALDQAKEYISIQKPNEEYKFPTFLYYDDKKNEWIAVDILTELRKKTKKMNPKVKKNK